MTGEDQALKAVAQNVRRNIIEMTSKGGGPGHPGPALSCADIVTALYYKVMRIKPEEPNWADRDRLILSKGHACPVIYAVLAEKGYFPKDWIYSFRKLGGKLQGHPDMNKIPGVDMTSGSLGHGLSAGLGMAIALKLRKSPAKVYVIIGDGESQEGMIWEAAMSAPKLGADNLIAIIDYNHFQSGGVTDNILSLEPIVDKWKAFNWNVVEANGHNIEEIVNKLEIAKMNTGRPTVLIAHSTKGKGVSYMENNNAWHQKVPSAEEYSIACKELV
ncbi:transketolase [Propionivibrio dicarboxylicus]|uniref:Transketolase subunit A n=1 Tax=Propionivibrio dicarboxylicus TaxID=83767 RepID=A0A1G7Z1I3_9RHOO|nr:transketolase [Propionivibrio dicarboxylicus]SDH02563.1 transketolase subunit A [Propionivibrio dicarboxylicus]